MRQKRGALLFPRSRPLRHRQEVTATFMKIALRASILFLFLGRFAFGSPASWMIVPAPFYSPETEFGGHVSAIGIFRGDGAESSVPSNVTLSANYTQKNQFSVFFLPNLYFDDGKFALKLFSAFQIYPNTFYGIGNSTLESSAETYASRIFWTRVRLLRSIQPGWSMGPAFEYEQHHILESESGGQIEQGVIPGSRGARYLGAGFALEHDTRDNTFSPTRGRFFDFSALSFPRPLTPDFSFHRFLLDVRHYVMLSLDHVIAFQGLLVGSIGDLPFQAMPKLGGDRLLRGIFFGRFQDRNLGAVQMEYRFPIWRRLSGVAFGGVGKVAPTLGGLVDSRFRPAGGLGLRVLALAKERVNLRVDVAASSDAQGVYFSFGEAF